MTKHQIHTTSVASVYPHYVTKAEKRGRTQAEVDGIIRWLTGYGQKDWGPNSSGKRILKRTLPRRRV